MTFVVGKDGAVHEQDLSKATDVRAQAPKKYDPDSAWQKAEELQEGTASEQNNKGKAFCG